MADTDATTTSSDELLVPPELANDPPRELPESAHRGRLATLRRQTFWGCVIAGAICMGLSWVPFVDTIALYFLPLAFLNWIGFGLCILGFVILVFGGEYKKACDYVREGEVGFGQVMELAMGPMAVVNGQPTAYAFQAIVAINHPETRQPTCLNLVSRNFSGDQKHRIDTRFRVGDHVPVVWMPGLFDATAQIYDFLELTPEASLVRYRESRGQTLLNLVLACIVIPGFFLILFWNVFAYGRYVPLDFDFLSQGLWPLAFGAVVGLFIVITGWLAARRSKQKITAKNVDAVERGEAIELAHEGSTIGKVLLWPIIVAGAALLGGLTFLCWCFTANALFDTSVARDEPVVITDMIQETHNFIFREYKIEYRRNGKNDDDSFLSTPDHMSRFVVPVGIAKIRAGRLGWPWVETIEPVQRAPAAALQVDE